MAQATQRSHPHHHRFFPADQDRARMPVAVLSGFLGSGKTTLINAMLRHPALADTAVAVNEFGAVALDQHLIARDEGDVLVLANGCLCCNLGDDAETAVMRLFTRRDEGGLPPFRRLLVEPSGLADPAPFAQAILRNPMMARVMRLSSIVTVVDALFGAQHLAQQGEAVGQVALADRIVLTKSDLADPSALRGLLAGLNPHAPILSAVLGEIDPQAIFAADFLDPDQPPEAVRAVFRADAVAPHAQAAEAVVLGCDHPLDWPALESFLRRLRLGHADALLRLKGLVALRGEGRPLLLQGIHHVLHPPILLDAWPDADHSTRLVLILRGADAATIRSDWAAFIQEA